MSRVQEPTDEAISRSSLPEKTDGAEASTGAVESNQAGCRGADAQVKSRRSLVAPPPLSHLLPSHPSVAFTQPGRQPAGAGQPANPATPPSHFLVPMETLLLSCTKPGFRIRIQNPQNSARIRPKHPPRRQILPSTSDGHATSHPLAVPRGRHCTLNSPSRCCGLAIVRRT